MKGTAAKGIWPTFGLFRPVHRRALPEMGSASPSGKWYNRAVADREGGA
jgi:hypothetical protein